MTDDGLLAELMSDPAGRGYKPLVAARDDTGLAALLNAAAEKFTVPQPVARGDFLLTIAAVHLRVPALADPVKKDVWNGVLATVRAVESLRVGAAAVQGLLAAAVADGVVSPEEKDALDALGRRPGNRAEELWGAGAAVAVGDVSRVLNGG